MGGAWGPLWAHGLLGMGCVHVFLEEEHAKYGNNMIVLVQIMQPNIFKNNS